MMTMTTHGQEVQREKIAQDNDDDDNVWMRRYSMFLFISFCFLQVITYYWHLFFKYLLNYYNIYPSCCTQHNNTMTTTTHGQEGTTRKNGPRDVYNVSWATSTVCFFLSFCFLITDTFFYRLKLLPTTLHPAWLRQHNNTWTRGFNTMLSSQEGMTGKINLGLIVIEYFVVVFLLQSISQKKKRQVRVRTWPRPGPTLVDPV